MIDFSVKAHDGVTIDGWKETVENPRGTMVFCHGYMSHCRHPELAARYLPICHKLRYDFVTFDFRNHGKSGNGQISKIPVVGIPAATFGKAESWDLHAVLNSLSCHNLILVGDSLGGMASQLQAMVDARIKKVFLHHTPAWPMHAVGVKVNKMATKVIAGAYASFYGFDILGAGDIRQFPPTPAHRPAVLHIMGDKDHYDITKTREVYDYLYRDHPELDGEQDLSNLSARKWFFSVPGAEHTDQSKGKNCVWHWSGYDKVFNDFVTMELQ